ncbi:hypothetical protein MHU86_18157 [Fragilaria crotonensis]|nr:hypothetical protein MHU86_18157 [Fragilaria crotonensis]
MVMNHRHCHWRRRRSPGGLLATQIPDNVAPAALSSLMDLGMLFGAASSFAGVKSPRPKWPPLKSTLGQATRAIQTARSTPQPWLWQPLLNNSSHPMTNDGICQDGEGRRVRRRVRQITGGEGRRVHTTRTIDSRSRHPRFHKKRWERRWLRNREDPGKAVSPAEQLFSCKMADASVCCCDAY